MSTSDVPPRSSRILSATAQKLVAVESFAQLRECLDECVASFFGKDHRGELVIEDGSGEYRAPVKPSAVADTKSFTVPLNGPVGGLGKILVYGPAPSQSDSDVWLGLAAQFALAVQRIRAREGLRSVGRMRTDLQHAQKVQHDTLPPPTMEDADFGVAVFYQPYFEVGGDAYEILQTAPGHLWVLVADASGKGVAAALLMMRIVGEFRILAQHSDSPAQVLDELNRSLIRRPAGDRFATALCVHLSLEDGSVVGANAGHVQPLLRTTRDVAIVCEPSGPPLGLLEDPGYVDEKSAFQPGDMLLMMTDGFSEPFDMEGALTEAETVKGLARAGADDEKTVCDRLKRGWEASFESSKRRAADDATLLVIRRPDTDVLQDAATHG